MLYDMTAPEPVTEAPQDPQGLDEDVPCPKCQYNLHGLTVPRCPECGFSFAWSDIPSFRPPPRAEAPTGAFVAVVAGILVTVVLAVAMGGPDAIAAITIGVAVVAVPAFVLGVVQTALELLAASIWIGRITGKRFRAWWEGVLIGYGACALTLLATGHGLLVFNDAYAWRLPRGSIPALVLTATESLVIQWWVVRRRMRQWDDSIPSKELLYACLMAKAVMAVLWTFLSPFFVRHL
jgi:hypothetical protein